MTRCETLLLARNSPIIDHRNHDHSEQNCLHTDQRKDDIESSEPIEISGQKPVFIPYARPSNPCIELSQVPYQTKTRYHLIFTPTSHQWPLSPLQWVGLQAAWEPQRGGRKRSKTAPNCKHFPPASKMGTNTPHTP